MFKVNSSACHCVCWPGRAEDAAVPVVRGDGAAGEQRGLWVPPITLGKFNLHVSGSSSRTPRAGTGKADGRFFCSASAAPGWNVPGFCARINVSLTGDKPSRFLSSRCPNAFGRWESASFQTSFPSSEEIIYPVIKGFLLLQAISFILMRTKLVQLILGLSVAVLSGQGLCPVPGCFGENRSGALLAPHSALSSEGRTSGRSRHLTTTYFCFCPVSVASPAGVTPSADGAVIQEQEPNLVIILRKREIGRTCPSLRNVMMSS